MVQPAKKSALLLVLVCLICNSVALAVPPATTQSAPATAPIARITLGSLQQVAATADDLGLPLLPIFTGAELEKMFPFIGAGGMRQELPITIDFLAGGDLQMAQAAVFYVPLVAGHAPITAFLQNGQPLGTDGALVNGTPFRRTGNYLIWGGTSDFVTSITPEKLPDARQDNPLLDITYDGKTLRTIAPEVIQKFRDTQLQQDAAGTHTQAELAGQRVAIDAMTRGLDSLELILEKREDQFRLTTRIEPSFVFTTQQFLLPGLPDTCAFRMDWQPPRNWARREYDSVVALIGANSFYDGAKIAPAQRAQFSEFFVRCLNTAFDGDQATYGMQLLDEGPVFYSVTQSKTPRDVHAEFVDIAKRSDELEKPGSKKTNSQVTDYKTDDGITLNRLVVFDDDGKPEMYVDSVDRGETRFMTIAHADIKEISRLMAVKPAGKLGEPATGWVDGKQLLDLIIAVSGSKTALTDEDHELLNKVLKGQRVNWAVNTNDHRLNVVTDVPLVLIKNIVQNSDALMKVMSKAN